MGNKVDVEINGKDNLSKAASSSSKSLETLAHTMMGPVELFKQLSSAAEAFVSSFAESEQGIKRLNFAIESTGTFTAGAVDRMREYAESIKAKTGVDEDEIIALENKLIVEGKSEEQTRRMVQVAVDYAAATGQDLTSALTAVEQAQLGSLKGQLKYFEGMKDLTKEQLANGAALDLIEQKTKGYAETLASGTVQGSINKMKNAFEDVQKSLGAALAPILTKVFDGLTWLANAFSSLPAPIQLFIGVVGGLTAAFIAVQAAVAAFGVTLNVALGPISLIIGGIAALTAGISALQAWSNGIGQEFADLSQGLLDTHTEASAALGPLNALTASQKLSSEQVSKLIELYPELNGVIKAGVTTTKEATQAELEANIQRQKAIQHDIQNKIYEIAVRARARGIPTAFEATELVNLDKRYREIGDTVVGLTSDLQDLTEKAKEIPPALGNTGKSADVLKDKFASLRDSLRTLITQISALKFDAVVNAFPSDMLESTLANLKRMRDELEAQILASSNVANMNETQLNALEALKEKYENLVESINRYTKALGDKQKAEESTGGLTTTQGQAKYEQNQRDIKASQPHVTALNNEPQAVSVFNTFAAMRPIMQLMDALGGLAGSFTSVMAIMNWGQTILEGAMTVLSPLVDVILTPIVGALKVVGELIGKVIAPILSVLGPIVTVLAEVFIWIYNKVFIPIGNVMIWCFNIIYNAGVWVYNWFHWFGSAMAYKPLTGEGSGMLTEISSSDLTKAGTTTGGGSSGGGSTTYSKPRDITISVMVNTPALVGEGGYRQFALMLRKEVQLALASGAT